MVRGKGKERWTGVAARAGGADVSRHTTLQMNVFKLKPRMTGGADETECRS